MSGEVEISNLALGRIKKGSILALAPDEDGAEAEECARFYPIARDFVLADFPFRANTRLVTLTPLVNDREDDWTYRYQRPTTCTNVRELLPETGVRRARKRIQFEAFGDDIYCNVQNARAIIQVELTDTTRFTPSMKSLIAWRLGYELVGPLDGEMGLMAWADRKYEAEKLKAWASDASEHVQNDDDADARSGSGELPTMISARD